MSDPLNLFGEPEGAPPPDAPPPPAAAPDAPLADRMRPRTLDEVAGQAHLAGPGGTLRRLLAAKHLPNLILHGPPGSGKTTLARVVAGATDAAFVPFNAVSEGVPRLREVEKEARARRRAGRRTLLFVDEIHRLNKGQQDFLLPLLESGLVTLVGATTEHPAFEIVPALLSRSQVLVLETLAPDDVRALLRRALEDGERGLGGSGTTLDDAAEELIVRATAGDARQALSALETGARLAGPGGAVTEELAREALLRRAPRYDASVMYEMLSAFHKSLRGSSPEGALFWAMRMIQAGEDPKTVFRRLVAAAYEDVGLADPRAGVVATQAMQAFERLGLPEGLLPLSNAILYVAQAPKSNRAYAALRAARAAAEEHPEARVPVHLRNPHTSLMKEWGFGEGYRYAHDEPAGFAAGQAYLPDELAGARWYEPGPLGFEREVAARMEERARAEGGDSADEEGAEP